MARTHPPVRLFLQHWSNKAYNKYKHSLTFRVRHYVVIAMKPMHRLQMCRIVHNYRASIPFPSYIQVHAVVWECGEGQTDTQTHTVHSVTNIHFALWLTRYVITYNTLWHWQKIPNYSQPALFGTPIWGDPTEFSITFGVNKTRIHGLLHGVDWSMREWLQSPKQNIWENLSSYFACWTAFQLPNHVKALTSTRKIIHRTSSFRDLPNNSSGNDATAFMLALPTFV